MMDDGSLSREIAEMRELITCTLDNYTKLMSITDKDYKKEIDILLDELNKLKKLEKDLKKKNH